MNYPYLGITNIKLKTASKESATSSRMHYAYYLSLHYQKIFQFVFGLVTSKNNTAHWMSFSTKIKDSV